MVQHGGQRKYRCTSGAVAAARLGATENSGPQGAMLIKTGSTGVGERGRRREPSTRAKRRIAAGPCLHEFVPPFWSALWLSGLLALERDFVPNTYCVA